MKALLMGLLVCLPTLTQAGNCGHIDILYNQRPPYLVETSRGVLGVTGTMVSQVFELAGIESHWVPIPFVRQLKTIEANQGCDCLAGVFKSPERAGYARFTDPLYQDQPQALLVRADDDRIKPEENLDDVFRRRDLVLEIKSGYSYGDYLDARIALLSPLVDTTTGESDQMVKKIAARRADYMFISPLEADVIISSAGFKSGDFRLLFISGMPAGERRYLMCSRRVDSELLQKLNAAITRYWQHPSRKQSGD